MKTQIIQLDTYDDIVSARDKLIWSKAPRILVVFPKKNCLEFSLIDLMVLYRQAQKQGAQIAFVVEDREILDRLDRIGVPGFVSTAEATRQRWRATRRAGQFDNNFSDRDKCRQEMISEGGKLRDRRKPLPGALRISFFLIGLLATASIFWFFTPKVIVKIDTENQTQGYKMLLQGSLARDTVLYTGVVPVYVFTILLDGAGEHISSGQISLPANKASGEIRLTNMTSTTIQVPAGTILSTNSSKPVRFQTTETVLLSAGPGETVFVAIEAINSGTEGNVGPGEIQAVEGELGLSVRVENPERIAGGSQATVPSPTTEDYQLLHDTLLNQLKAEASEKVFTFLKPGQKYIQGSLTLSEVVNEEGRPAVGFPGEKLELWMQVEFTGWYIIESDISTVASFMLDATLPKGYVPLEEDLLISYLGEPVIFDQNVTLNLEVFRQIKKQILTRDIIELIAGRDPDLAEGLLKSKYALLTDPSIDLVPEWWPILPIMGFQFEVSEQ